MKRKFFAVAFLLLRSFSIFSQSFLTPSEGFKTESVLSDYTTFSVYDFYGNNLFVGDGNTIYCFDADTEALIYTYEAPSGAGEYAAFLTVSPDGTTLWVGFTTTYNVDDRIYSIDIESGTWTHQAVFPANMEIDFWGEHILVSGLNSTDWTAAASIFLLDISGENDHRKIIEIEGNTAGLAVDSDGNVYYASSVYGATNHLYRWSNEAVAAVVSNPELPVLTVADAVILSTMPAGAYDCAVDEGGNVLFDFNDYSGDKVLAMWNKTEGNNDNYDIIATSNDWIGMLATRGNIMSGSEVIVSSYGFPLAKIYRDNVDIQENMTLQSNVVIYPNPTSGIFKIDAAEKMQSVEVFNMLGQKVYGTFSENMNFTIDLSNCVKGNYIIKMQQGNQQISKIVVVQ